MADSTEEVENLIRLEEEYEGNSVGTSDFIFRKIGSSVPLKPSDSSFDFETVPSEALAVSERFGVVFLAHSEGFYVAKTKDVIELAKKIKEKGKGSGSIQELSIVDVTIGGVSILALSTDSSTLAACVGGEIHLFSVVSLINKEKEPSFSHSLGESSHVKDLRWRKNEENSYVVLSTDGKLYYGDLESPLKDVMDSVDAVDWSVKGDYIAVARENALRILSSDLKERLHMLLLFKPWANDTDHITKVDSIKWVRGDSIIIGCLQLTDDGDEEGYLVQVITNNEEVPIKASSKPCVISFCELFAGLDDQIVPCGSGPYLFASYLERWQLVLASNRKNTDQHIFSLGWSLDDNNREAAVIEFLDEKEVPRIELPENGDDNLIVGFGVVKVSLYEKIEYIKSDQEQKELFPYCVLLCLTSDGKLIMFLAARISDPSVLPTVPPGGITSVEEDSSAVASRKPTMEDGRIETAVLDDKSSRMSKEAFDINRDDNRVLRESLNFPSLAGQPSDILTNKSSVTSDAGYQVCDSLLVASNKGPEYVGTIQKCEVDAETSSSSRRQEEQDDSGTNLGISSQQNSNLGRLPVLLREKRDCIKMMLIGITQSLTNGRLDQLSNCRRVAGIIFSMNWAPLDIRPLRIAFDELFVYLESLTKLCGLSPTALFEQEVEERLTSLQTQLEARRQELDVPVTALGETLAALSVLRGSIDRTRLVLADLNRQFAFQQQRLDEQSSRIKACHYSFSLAENELKEFEAILNDCLGVDWRWQEEKALLGKKYIAAKKEMMKRHIEDFNAKCQAFHDNIQEKSSTQTSISPSVSPFKWAKDKVGSLPVGPASPLVQQRVDIPPLSRDVAASPLSILQNNMKENMSSSQSSNATGTFVAQSSTSMVQNTFMNETGYSIQSETLNQTSLRVSSTALATKPASPRKTVHMKTQASDFSNFKGGESLQSKQMVGSMNPGARTLESSFSVPQKVRASLFSFQTDTPSTVQYGETATSSIISSSPPQPFTPPFPSSTSSSSSLFSASSLSSSSSAGASFSSSSAEPSPLAMPFGQSVPSMGIENTVPLRTSSSVSTSSFLPSSGPFSFQTQKQQFSPPIPSPTENVATHSPSPQPEVLDELSSILGPAHSASEISGGSSSGNQPSSHSTMSTFNIYGDASNAAAAALNSQPETSSAAQVLFPAQSVSATQGKTKAFDSTVTEEDEMEEEAPETTGLSLASLYGFGLAPIPNPFGVSLGAASAASPASSQFSLTVPSGESFRPASFSFSSPTPQPSQPMSHGGFSGFGTGPTLTPSIGSGFGYARIPNPFSVSSVHGAFGQSRQLGPSPPGVGFASSSGFGSAGFSPDAVIGGFGSGAGFAGSATGIGFAGASKGGGFAGVASAGGGFSVAATSGFGTGPTLTPSTSSGFGCPAQIGSGQQPLGSVLGAFGQSRQLGPSPPGVGFASSSGFGGAGFSPAAMSEGFGSGARFAGSPTGCGFAGASAGGGVAGVASAGGGFAAAATSGGGFAAAASAGSRLAGATLGAPTGGFGAFSYSGGFSSFGGKPPSRR